MANVYITVWGSAGEVAHGDPLQFIVAEIDAGPSAAITADKRKRRRVRLLADADVFVQYGASPSATDGTDSIALGADNPEYFDIESGHSLDAITRA